MRDPDHGAISGGCDAGLSWASDQALLITFAGARPDAAGERVRAAYEAVAAARIPGLRNLNPAHASVLATCDLLAVTPDAFEAAVRAAVAAAAPRCETAPRVITIPVCYEGAHAPDLDDLARLRGLSRADVVRLHAGASYVVRFLGFAPGFPYLDGLPDVLAAPRLSSPRARVAAGSVAIGGRYAGVYPCATPGGWRLIGRTPLRLFALDRDPPALLEPGDHVRFVPVCEARFRELQA